MKKHFFLSLTFLASIVFLNSCRNDFDIAAQWKEIPIIYGLLDADSNVQYIKIEKAFLDKSISAYTMASNADSIYFLQKLNVKLFATDKITNEKIASETYLCELVNGDTIGLKKENGIFATSPNYFFRLKHKLNYLYDYNLEVSKPDGSIIATSKTAILGKTRFADAYTTSTSGFNFYVKNLQSPNKILISIAPDNNAVTCDMVIRTYYKELPATNNDSIFYVDWYVISGAPYYLSKPKNGDNPSLIGTGYFQNLKVKLEDKPKNVKRYFDRMDFIVYSGNKFFEDYRNVVKAQSGFTSGNSQPIYTNIVGGGIGLFASRNTSTLKNVRLANQSLDSLKRGMYTGNLGFDN